MTAIGSPLYDLADGHLGALLAVLCLPLLGWLTATLASHRDPARSRVRRIVDGYRALPLTSRAIVWLLAASAAVHAGLAADTGHAATGLPILFLLQAVVLGVALVRLALGRSWRRIAIPALLGTLVAYWAAVLGGEAPDQLGIATALLEIGALALVIRPSPASAVRRWSAVLGIIALVVVTDVVAWAGAAQASGGTEALAAVADHDAGPGGGASADDGHGHGHGRQPAPGVVMRLPAATEPSPAERAAAANLHAAVTRGIAPFEDPAVALAAGYQVPAIVGTDVHAGNEAYEHDGRTLDPERPETLVYAQGPDGRPVLLGAMFLMEGMGSPGPTIGGPLTIWHGHEQVCVSLVPPAITAILSPLGGCPVGSFVVPRTPEMIHVWTVPGAPQPFGDLDPTWLRDYLDGLGRREELGG